MCTPESADETPTSEAAPSASPGPLVVLGQRVRVVQSGFGSLAAWLEVLRVLGEGGARLGDGCFRLLAPRLLLQQRLAWA